MNSLTIPFQRHWHRAGDAFNGLRLAGAGEYIRWAMICLVPTLLSAYLGYGLLDLGGATLLAATLWLAGLLLLALAAEGAGRPGAAMFTLAGILVMTFALLGKVGGEAWLHGGIWTLALSIAGLLARRKGAAR